MALVLFLPDAVIAKTGLLTIRNENLAWVGLGFFASTALFLASALEALARLASGSLSDIFARRRMTKSLSNLARDEKEFLRIYIDEDQSSLSVPLSHGVASRLAGMRVLVRTSQLSNYSGDFPYALQPWAREVLLKNPQFLS